MKVQDIFTMLKGTWNLLKWLEIYENIILHTRPALPKITDRLATKLGTPKGNWMVNFNQPFNPATALVFCTWFQGGKTFQLFRVVLSIHEVMFQFPLWSDSICRIPTFRWRCLEQEKTQLHSLLACWFSVLTCGSTKNHSPTQEKKK